MPPLLTSTHYQARRCWGTRRHDTRICDITHMVEVIQRSIGKPATACLLGTTTDSQRRVGR